MPLDAPVITTTLPRSGPLIGEPVKGGGWSGAAERSTGVVKVSLTSMGDSWSAVAPA